MLFFAAHALAGVAGFYVLADVQPGSGVSSPREADDGKRAKGKGRAKSWAPTPEPAPTLAFNPFCPSCAPDEATPSKPAAPPPEGVDLLHPAEVETQLPLTLVATMEAEPPGVSLATISRGSGATGVFAEGELILQEVWLHEVDNGVVHLRAGQRYEFLRLVDHSVRKGKKGSNKKKKDTKKKKKSKYELEGARDSIECKGRNCTVEREFIAELIAKPSLLVRQGRARPYSRRGLTGFRLSRVRRGTIPYLLGMRSGDLITEINGMPLTSMDEAMQAFTKMRRASHLTVEVTRSRRGKRKGMRWEIDIV